MSEERIISTEYSDVMQKSYIDYAMSVILARAVPDVRDGLKPVQRRVLYAMNELGLRPDRPHRKSARIVGDAMGKYHPHGDSSIYETLVVMEQDFKKEIPLVDGHGNFGSIEGDSAAAMRYTEARLAKYTQDVYLADLDKNVVDFVPNFDETEREPAVLPARVPNVLINGAEGIAVGMTTNIPTHNLGEVVDAMIALMNNPSVTTGELMEYVKGPDFPTGGIVINKSELKDIYESGSGKIKLRGKVEFESAKKKTGRDKLVITEIPYTMIGANIEKFILSVCDLVETKKTTDIVDISNESSKLGMRIVLELKKGADPKKVENLLYKKTRLEDTFGVNMLVIKDGRPEVLGLKGILESSIEFQYEINTRKYTYLLEKDEEQKEIKEGLIKACDIIDLIIEIIRGSQNISQAKACLTKGETGKIKFKSEAARKEASQLSFTEAQAQAILDLRLAKLIGLEILQLKKEYEALSAEIEKFKKILSDKKAMKKVIIKDLEAIKKEYGFERRTIITDGEAAVYEEEKIREQEVVFLMDRFGYTKTVDVSAYERNAESLDKENRHVIRCMNTDSICIFTSGGVMHQVKVLKLPLKKPKDKGVPIDNLCNYSSSKENIAAIFALADVKASKLLFTTALGMMKFVDGDEFNVSKRTIAATKLLEGDDVISIHLFEDFSEEYYGSGYGENNIAISGGSDFVISEFTDPEDGQLRFDFIGPGAGDGLNFDETAGISGSDGAVSDKKTGKKPFSTNKMAVLQSADGVFLRLRLEEVPEKKKNAVGVRGIRLNPGDRLEKVYITAAGDKTFIMYREKEIELMKIKLARRDTKGTKLRG